VADVLSWLGSLRAPELLDLLGDVVLVLDAERRVRFANAQAQRLLGCSAQSLLGKPFESLLHDSDLVALTGLESTLRTDVERDLSLLFRDGDDGCIQMRATVSRRPAEGDTPAFYLLSCRDVRSFQALLSDSSRAAALHSERADYEARARDEAEERELREVQEGQARKLEAIGQLAAGVAHEINTPIQFMSDNLRFLQTAAKELLAFATACAAAQTLDQVRAGLHAVDLAYLAEELPAAFEQTLDGAARVARIVRAMKDFSHPSDGRHTLVDLRDIVETTLTLARNTWQPLAEVEVDADPDLPPVECIADELTQVLLNMLVNACHAIEERQAAGDATAGRITLRVRADASDVEVRISDNGAGIAAENLEKIFDPFFTTKQVGRGTGQGLALAYTSLVHHHAGHLSVTSTPGRGTTFTIRLPLVAPAAAADD
jgi:PAS domain S-box-containing protein